MLKEGWDTAVSIFSYSIYSKYLTYIVLVKKFRTPTFSQNYDILNCSLLCIRPCKYFPFSLSQIELLPQLLLPHLRQPPQAGTPRGRLQEQHNDSQRKRTLELFIWRTTLEQCRILNLTNWYQSSYYYLFFFLIWLSLSCFLNVMDWFQLH